ncbi:FecR domain-containing protein [Planctomycetota bacterium]
MNDIRGRAQALTGKYLDGRIDDEELRELERLLDNHEGARVAFLNEARLCDELGLVMESSGSMERTSHQPHVPTAQREFLLHPRRRPVRWGAWISVAACLAVIVGAVVYNARQEQRFVEVMVARIQQASPGVTVVRADGNTVVAVVGLDLFAGDRIATKKGGKLVFAYPGEKTNVTAGSDGRETVFSIGDSKEGKRIHLEKGVLDAAVDPQPADRHMVVTTPHASCEVKGTRFVLAVDARMTRIDVTEGKVLFARRAEGDSILVVAVGFATAGEAIAQAARYGDGDVIMEDDFENGLGKWKLTGTYHYPDGRVEQQEIVTAQEAREYIGTVEVERDGGKTLVARLTVGVFEGYTIHFGFEPREIPQPITSPVVWEFDLLIRYERDRGVALGAGAAGEVPKSQLNVWRRWRAEYRPVENPTDERAWRYRSSCDGKIQQDDYIGRKQAVLGMAAGPGVVLMMDNVVVRKLVVE